MKLLIAGCGYLGTALAEHFAQKGNEVWGLRRGAPPRGDSKFYPITADLLDPKTLKGLPVVDTVIFCQAPKRGVDNYRDTYFEATKNLLSVLKREGRPQRIIFISSTSVYGTRDGSWVDETTPPAVQGYATPQEESQAKILLDTEDLVRSSGFSPIIFRLGGIYGPGRHRLRLLKEGKIQPSFSNAYVNRIRLEDIVAGAELLLNKGKGGQVYLGVDDEPVTQKEFYSWIARELCMNISNGRDAETFSGKRCSNKRIKELGMKFQYPTFREGYQDLLKEAL